MPGWTWTEFQPLPAKASASRVEIALFIVFEVTGHNRNVFKKISPLSFKPFAFFKLTVKVFPILLPTLSEAFLVAQQGTGLGLAVCKIASTMVMRKTGKGSLTSRFNLLQLLRAHF